MDRLSFFKDGTSKICGSLDINEALHDCLRFLQGYMPINCILFGLFELEIGALRILALAADFPVKYPTGILALSAESQVYMKSHSGKMLMTDTAASTPSTAFGRELSAALGLPNLTGIGIPLDIRGAFLGGVGVLSKSGQPLKRSPVATGTAA